MSQKWLQAAEQYRRKNEEKSQEKIEQSITTGESHLLTTDELQIKAGLMAYAADDLQKFMNSDEGAAAKALLAASNRHIIFGEESEGGFANVVFIDRNGLQRSYEASGMWVAYSTNVPEPRISPVQPHEAIQAAVYYSRKKPNEVMTWLRAELDKIANAVQSESERDPVNVR